MATLDTDPQGEALDPIEDNQLRPEFVDEVLEALDTGDPEAAAALVEPLHPADIADLFELIEPRCRRSLAAALGERLDAGVIAELTDPVRDEILEHLEPAKVAQVVAELDTDDAVALVEDLEADEQEAVLGSIPPEDRAAIEDALAYPEETAGRIMRRDLVAVPDHWKVGQVIDFLRDNPDLTTEFWEIFVVDMGHHPVGTVRLSWVLRSPRGVALADLMQREQTLIPVDMDQEEVGLIFQKYALISAAVVDDNERLVGVITVDDILHVIQQEASEDILLLSGAGDEGDVNEPVRDAVRARIRWLVANLGTALVGSSIIAAFGAAIEQMVALAVLMPIVASLGGNAATQTMAITVRALATNQLTESNTPRTIRKEISVAAINGAAIAVLIGIGTTLVFSNPGLGAVIAAAMVINIVIAGLAGVFVPLGLDRAGQDPAIASSVFVTMITDAMGFLALLGLATATGLVG